MDSSSWTIVNIQSDNVTISNVTINDDGLLPYRDGIDVVDCWHVVIADCTVNSGDDAICLKSGAPRGVQDVVVQNCTIPQAGANGLKLGTASTGSFSNILFQNITILNTQLAAIAVESVDGGTITNLTFKDINFSGCQNAIFMILGTRDAGVEPGIIDGVQFINITGANLVDNRGCPISGEMTDGVTYYLQNILFDNVNIAFDGYLRYVPSPPPEYVGEYPENTMWGDLPAYGYYIRHAKNVTFTNCSVSETADLRPWLDTDDVSGLAVIGGALEIPPSVAGFGGAGAGWMLNGGATVTSNVLKLTGGGTYEARSAFFKVPQVVSNFQAQFVYQATGVGDNKLGDGAAFVVENAPAGVSALGGDGGGLGYTGIPSSAAIEFYLESGMGTRLATGGSAGSYTSTLPVNLASGDPISVVLSYNGTSLVENLLDETTGASYSTTYAVNIPLAMGGSNTAYVGFTAADGALVSVQTISDFAYSSLPAVSGFGNAGSGWTLNGGATVTSNVLKLTDGGTYEARSAFFNEPQPVASFQAQFIYQATGVGDITLGDGATFVVEDASAGVKALGNNASGLGYGGIPSSAAVEFYLESGMGTRLSTGGSVGNYTSTLPVNLASGDPIRVVLSYNGSSFVENLVDMVTGASYSTNYTVNIPAAVGGSNMAWVGFTGAAGGAVSVQTISDFSYSPINLYNATPIISPNGGIFTNSVSVSLALPSNAPSSQIYYTLNGTTPTTNSTLYSEAFILTKSTAVQAMTVVPGFVNNPVASAVFSNTIADFGGNGSGWTFNGGAKVTSNVLKLTDGGSYEARSAFFDVPQVVNNFQAQFIYQAAASGGKPLGDGATFVVQDSPVGLSALGTDGGGLGYAGIAFSTAIELCVDSSSKGTRLATSANTGGYTSTLPVNLDSGDPISVVLNYNGTTLTENLVDETTGASYNTSYAVNIPAIVGGSDTGYVGFTGGTGASISVQTISDFTFRASAATPNKMSTIAHNQKDILLRPPTFSAVAAGNKLSIFWPASEANYHLEFTTNLSAPTSWQAVPQTPVITNGLSTILIPRGTTSTFFRLARP